CGHPFPRQAEPVSSLVNCAQGHIYSAVYNHCPYCPQPVVAPVAPTVKETETAFEIPVQGENGSRAGDLVTRLGDEERMLAEQPVHQGQVVAASQPLVSADPAPAAPERNSGNLNPINGSRSFGGEVAPTRNGRRPISSRLAGVANGGVENSRPTPPDPDPVRVQMPVGGATPPPANGFGGVGGVGGVGGGAPSVAPVVGGVQFSNGAEGRRTVFAASEVGTGAASRGKIVGWLISYTANPDGEDFRIYAGHNRIGANPICDIVINDDTVSGSHAILVYREGRCLLKDDLSRNGTFVNGREITEAHPLQNYDQIRLGNTYLIFVSAQRI
ncbi:MAG: FHA domain-containing protein, partial [Acidobacteriota bacterium]